MFNRWQQIPPKNVLLLGPRRAGKTTLLKANLGSEYEYVTLDDLDALAFAKSDPKGFVESCSPRVIIDEIQRVPGLTIAVKKAIDEGTAEFAMTGSSSIGLLDQSADSLAGRIVIKHLPTACWGEEEGSPTHSFFSDILKMPEVASAKRKFERALLYGGFPEVVTQSSDDARKEILRNYRDTYFTRDLAQLSNIENIDGLHAILLHLAKSIGSHLEVSNFARESALSYITAKKYLNVLIHSELAFKLPGFQFGPAKRLLKASKYYYSDSGMFTAFRADISRGQLVENFVIAELEKRRKLGFIDADTFYYYKSNSGAEIDLIIEEENCLRIIEIKSTATVTPRDMRNLMQYKATYKGKKILHPYVIYCGTEYKEIDGIRCLPVYALYRAR